jgi:hypothetical protein
VKRFGRGPVFVVGIVLMTIISTVVIRAALESRAELSMGLEYERAGEPLRAIAHYRRALRWSLPFDGRTEHALESMRSLARSFEARGQIDDALVAWRSILGGVAATRFIATRRRPHREEAIEEIARLVAEHQRTGIDADTDFVELVAEHRELLEKGTSPHPVWGTMLLVGFAGWLTGLMLTASRGFAPSGRLQWQRARVPLTAALLGWMVFVLGLVWA